MPLWNVLDGYFYGATRLCPKACATVASGAPQPFTYIQ